MKKRILPVLIACLILSGCSIACLPPVTGGQPAPSGGGLTVHFLDVGQADCTLVECDGQYMLIDGGNVEDGRFVVSYLLRHGVEQIHTLICTHPHEDHAGGLAAVLAVFPVQTILSPTATYASEFFDDFLYYAGQQQTAIDIPNPGDTYSLGSAAVTVLGPVKDYAEINDTSIVVRLDYGETSFLFTGDMETTAENDMMEYWDDAWQQADVLKVGHHGSDTSTGYRFLYETAPDYAVISVGRDNPYGHPHDRPMSRLLHAGCTVFRTDRLGTVTATSDGQEITFDWERRHRQPESESKSSSDAYVGNQNSHVFHTTDCENLPGVHNRVYFGSYLDFIAAGYVPCGYCLD